MVKGSHPSRHTRAMTVSEIMSVFQVRAFMCKKKSLHSALVEIKGEQKEGLTSSVVLPAVRGLQRSRSNRKMFEDFEGTCPPCTCVVCGAVLSSVQTHLFLLCPARLSPLSLFAASPNSSTLVAMAGERIFTDGMTACLLGRGELNKLKLSYFPFAFLRAKLWTATFKAWRKLYLCPHARDVWGPQRSSSWMLSLWVLCVLHQQGHQRNVPGARQSQSRAPSRGTAGHPRFASHLKRGLLGPGFDKGMF